MSTISIFVASPTDLAKERESLKSLANDLNVKHSRKSGTNVEVISYENIIANEQKDYDNYIKNDAGLVLVIFDADKLDKSKGKGKQTMGEYDKAIDSYKVNGHPEVIVFTHPSKDEEKNRELRDIQDYVLKTSGKYCVEYENLKDLKNQARDYIKQYVGKKTSTSYKLKQFLRYAIPALAVLLIVGISFLFFSLDDKNHVYIETSIQPSISTKFNQNLIEAQITHDMNDLEGETKNKLEDILSKIKLEKTIEFAQMDSLHPTITSYLDKVCVKEGNSKIPFIKTIRKAMGKNDVSADINFTKSDSNIICSIQVEDWNKELHQKKIVAPISNGENEQECLSVLIRKCATFIAGLYAPVVPVLYDYEQGDELADYQSVTPWHNEYFDSDAERELFVIETLEGDHPALAYFLLANYYEETGMYEEDSNMLQSAVMYYNKVLGHDTTYQEEIRYKINGIEKYIKENKTVSVTKSLPEVLEQNGDISIKNCQQLIVVKGQEKLFVKGQHYYKATFYTFEKGHDSQWNEVLTPFKVNLGAHGIVSKEQKKEGDLSTPEGYYAIPFVFGYKNNIDTKMDFIEVGKNHVWVCNPKSDKYNTLVVDNTGEYTKDEKNEKLLSTKTDILNEYAIVVDYNTNPIIKGKGSAIFMHVERNSNHRTAGCISMPRETIIKVIQWLNPDKHPHVYISKKP